MHPILRDDASLGTFHNQGSEEMHYYAKNAAGDRIEIDHQTLEALCLRLIYSVMRTEMNLL